jgi:hypothetical protein
VAIVVGLVVLGVTQLGGGGSDSANGGGDSGGGGGAGNGGGAKAGIPFEPFTKATAFAVEAPKGWELRQLERQNKTSIKTKLVKPDGGGNVQIVQESTAQSPTERAQNALDERQQEADQAGTTFTPLIDPPEQSTVGGRSAALLGYQWKEEPGMPPEPVSVFNYVFDDTSSGWRTRAAIAGTNAKTQKQAKAIATQMASTLQPK